MTVPQPLPRPHPASLDTISLFWTVAVGKAGDTSFCNDAHSRLILCIPALAAETHMVYAALNFREAIISPLRRANLAATKHVIIKLYQALE